jgi:hypothetical protein
MAASKLRSLVTFLARSFRFRAVDLHRLIRSFYRRAARRRPPRQHALCSTSPGTIVTLVSTLWITVSSHTKLTR